MSDPFSREAVILGQYSKPGLKTTELTRAQKKAHLEGLKLSKDAVEKILDDLYGKEPNATPNSKGT